MTKPTRAALPILTRAESEIMALFWERGAMTVQGLQAHLPAKAYTSLATLVKILERKGYLLHGSPDAGRAFVFAPAVPPREVKKRHVRDLVDCLFGGKVDDLVTGLLNDEKLSREELQALRDEIDAKLVKRRSR